MILKILKDSKYKIIVKSILALLAIAFSILYFTDYIPIKYINAFWIPFWLVIFGGDYFLYNKMGHISLNEDNIEIKKVDKNNETILHSNIKELKIYGKKFNFVFFKTVLIYSLNIILSDEQEKFFIASFSQKDKPEFLSLLKKYYEKGINVKEFGANGDSQFLDEANLSYKQVQEFKEKYKITW